MVSRMLRAAACKVVVAIAMVGALVAGGLALVPAAHAAPEPSPIPKRWQLEISTSPLMMAVVGGRSYFFMTYRVTNNSPQDQLFAPAFELATDEGDLVRSGRDVPVEVTREIITRLADPMIEDQISIVGNLLRGPENAKTGVVVWPMPQQFNAQISIFAAGFSGETAVVEVPSASGKSEKKLLRKTWMMRYSLPGQLKPGTGEAFLPVESRWIMR
ncbi:MAG: hypothetical protein KF678_06450 [Phycisphaeraceae bacterium]|nr:hypothetical protein [Phycisphaeraceae bacterium]